MTRFFYIIIITLSLLGSLKAPGMANELDQIVQVALKKGWRKENGDHIAALQITLAPGWKTYWRQPGDTGISPKFDFSSSENLMILDVIYPVPKINWEDNYRSFVYYENVIFPILIRPEATGTAALRGKIEIGVCREICIPASFQVSTFLLDITQEDILIKHALISQPEVGLGKVICDFKPISNGMQISLHLTLPDQKIQDAIIELGDPKLTVKMPEISQSGRQTKIVAKILTPTGSAVSVTRSKVLTTVFSEKNVTQFAGCRSF